MPSKTRRNRLKQLRSAYSKEPVLKIHRYIVAVGQVKTDRATGKEYWNTKYHYCVNKREVKELRNALANQKKTKSGTVIEVHRARHDFVEGFITSKWKV